MGFSRWRGAKRPAKVQARHTREAVAAQAAVLLAMGLGSAVVAPAQAYQAADTLPQPTADAANKTVDLDLANADLSLVVDAIQRQTHANIVILAGDRPFGKVNVHLTGMALDHALQNVAMSAGAVVTRDTDGTYILKSDDGQTASMPQAQAVAAPHNDADYHWYKLILQHAVPIKVLSLLHWDNGVKDESPYNEPEPVHTEPLINNPAPVVLMNNGNYNVPSVPGGTGQTGPTQANRSVDNPSGEQAQQFPGGGFGGGGFGGGGFGGGGFGGGGGGFPGGPGGIPGQGVGNNGGRGVGGQAQLPPDVDEIIALQADNSLLIKATPEAFQRIREIIKYIDVAPRQVQIRVEFVRADVNDVDEFGINYDFVPYPGVSFQSQLGQGGNSYGLNFAVGNVVGQMYATLTHGRAKILNAPIITTTNNVNGQIEVTDEIPVTTNTTVVPNGGQAVTTSNVQFEDIDTTFSITPRINSDDSITLPVNISIGTPGAAVGTTGAVALNNQSLETVRTVKSGETMVLGGLINDNESNARTSIPILGDLPLIGGMFRNRDTSVSNTELLIFVTPTIIGDEDASNNSSAASGSSITP